MQLNPQRNSIASVTEKPAPSVPRRRTSASPRTSQCAQANAHAPDASRSEMVRGLSQRPSRKLSSLLVPARARNATTRAAAIDITLQRFAEYHNLQGAFGRRALIEQAKGILMARHAITADSAFEMLRDHSQRNRRKLIDVAEAIVESHLLLLPPLAQAPSQPVPPN